MKLLTTLSVITTCLVSSMAATAAESQIRDGDFATESAKLTRAQILAPSDADELAQSNTSYKKRQSA